MKKIIVAVIVIILSILFYSCQDIVNIGKPEKKLLHDDPLPPDDPTKKSTIFDVKDIYFNFREMANNTNMEWGSSYNFLRKVIRMDTSGEANYLWLDIEVECTIPDKYISLRADRLTRISLKLDSLTLQKNMNELIAENKNNWCNINIKELLSNNTFSYTNNDFNFIFMIYTDEKKLLKGGFFIELSSLNKFETLGFEGVFEFKY